MTDAGGALLTGLGAWNNSPYQDHSISGQLCTWTGEGSTALWSDSGNWLNGLYPSWGQPACVDFTTTQYTTQTEPDFTGAPPLLSIEFSASNYTLVGGPITLLSTADPSIDANISVNIGVTGCTISANLMVGLAGGGALVMAGPGTIELTGQNTFTGGTIISDGTLVMGGSGALGASGNGIEIDNGGKLDLAGNDLTAGTVALTDGSIVDSSNGQGELTASAVDVVDGTISANLAATTLDKLGSATAVLSGDDTCSGLTTVYSGTLELASASAQASVLSGRRRHRGRENPVRLQRRGSGDEVHLGTAGRHDL